jgi:ArsR family transcriptional regulator, arsenate/arsenite/antimonite-responsive transcriptional repressor
MDGAPAARSAPGDACRADVLRKARPRRASASVTDTASVLKALADPTRLTIVALLQRQAVPLCVCHVEARFRLSQPTISHHLRLLREAGLVRSDKRGAWVYYAIDDERVASIPGLRALLASIDLGPGEVRPCCE